MKPAVSVIMPTYRGAAYVGPALQSIFQQTLPPLEIIVIDDASPDGTADEAARVLADATVPTKLLRLPKNSGGPARPINEGIAVARGEFIAILDQDDVLTPDKLRDQVTALSSKPECSFAFGQCCLLGQPDVILDVEVLETLVHEFGQLEEGVYRLNGQRLLQRFLLEGHCVIGFPGFLFRRAGWLSRGGINERLRIAGDYDFLCWLCNQGDALYVPRIHYHRRLHGDNLTTENVAMRVEMARVRGLHAKANAVLAHDRVFQEQLQERFLAAAYILRNGGHYRDAFAVLSIGAGVWGWRLGLVAAAAKLVPHWLARALLPRQS